MKKLTLLLALIANLACFAQTTTGINFNKDQKWTDVLAQAKASKKLIFLDMYTDWCGPCKVMDAEVFPMKPVGDVFNSSFINYKLNAEKGEGPAVRKKYDVASYPNYLFVDGDGTLIYRSGGSMPAYEFLQNAKNALLEAKEPQTIVQMETLYPAHKTDKDFMFTYLSRLTKLRLPTIPMLDDYVAMLNTGERADPKNILLIINNGTFLNRKLPLGIALGVLKQNTAVYNELDAKGLVKNNESIKSIEHNAMDVSLKMAIENKDDKLFAKVRNLKEDVKADPFDNKLTLAMDYYYNTHNIAQYKNTTKVYANFLMHFSMDTLNKWDDRTYYHIKADIEKKNDPNYNNHENIYSYRHTQTIQLARKLSEASEQMMSLKLTKDELLLVKTWALKAVHIGETDMEYYKNSYPHYQRTYAIALYKDGQKHAAILQMQKTIAGMPKTDSAQGQIQFGDLLTKMVANEKL